MHVASRTHPVESVFACLCQLELWLILLLSVNNILDFFFCRFGLSIGLAPGGAWKLLPVRNAFNTRWNYYQGWRRLRVPPWLPSWYPCQLDGPETGNLSRNIWQSWWYRGLFVTSCTDKITIHKRASLGKRNRAGKMSMKAISSVQCNAMFGCKAQCQQYIVKLCIKLMKLASLQGKIFSHVSKALRWPNLRNRELKKVRRK